MPCRNDIKTNINAVLITQLRQELDEERDLRKKHLKV